MRNRCVIRLRRSRSNHRGMCSAFSWQMLRPPSIRSVLQSFSACSATSSGMASQASPRLELESTSAVLPLLAPRSREVVRLRIVDAHGRQSIQTLEPAQASERGEEIVQLSEGRSYEYELLDVDAGLDLEKSAIVQPSNLRRGTGRLEPGVATGLLTLRVIDTKSGEDVASAGVEVRTSKTGYPPHYRRILADTAEASCALLLDVRAPSQTRLTSDRRDPASLHEQFVILRGLLERNESRDAVARVLDLPARKWVTESVETDPRKPFRPGRSITSQIASRPQRIRLPEGHPLSARLFALGSAEPSAPAHFTVKHQADTLDTPENRFVKFVLEEWESFLVDVAVRLGGNESPASRRVAREVEAIRKIVSGWLSHRLFTEVGVLTALPLASPVLQKRAGYREVLRTWLTFRAGTALVWSGGGDVFGGGSKDVALLYEYWVFFQLLAI